MNITAHVSLTADAVEEIVRVAIEERIDHSRTVSGVEWSTGSDHRPRCIVKFEDEEI